MQEKQNTLKKIDVVIKSENRIKVLESRFHEEELWKNEREMPRICTNEIEKIHFVQPKNQDKQMIDRMKIISVQDMCPKDELYIELAVLS